MSVEEKNKAIINRLREAISREDFDEYCAPANAQELRVTTAGIRRSFPDYHNNTVIQKTTWPGVSWLEFHPLDPLSPPLRSLERLGVVAPVAPYPPVLELQYHHHVEHLPAAALVECLNDPQPVPDEHSTQPEGRRAAGASLLFLMFSRPRIVSPDWGISIM
jgi:hypothetical protein